MKSKAIKIHPSDNAIVALTDLSVGEIIALNGEEYIVQNRIAAKHKFAAQDFAPGDPILMYGVTVGKAQTAIPKGAHLSVENIKHATNTFQVRDRKTTWQVPDVSEYAHRTFMGYHRSDGRVGTANYWLVIPLVFCENRNIEVLKEALVHDLGYGRKGHYHQQAQDLIQLYKAGKTAEEILSADLVGATLGKGHTRLFPNVDGVKFLSHQGGCGGTRQDSEALCGLLAGYITHPNVAGATVLSLGCQNAQVSSLEREIAKRDPAFNKPLYILEQQKLGTEVAMMGEALIRTFTGLMQANECKRTPAPLSKLCIGLEV